MDAVSFCWDDLRVFLAVYRTRALESAADQLDMPSTRLRRRLADLEDDLGTRLFEVSDTRCTPTRAAEEMLPVAQQAEAAFAEVERTLVGRDTQPGTSPVRIGVADEMAGAVVSPALARMFERRHDQNVELLTDRDIGDPGTPSVDLAVQSMRPTRPDVQAERIASSRLVIAGTVAYLEGRHTEDAGALDWLTYHEGRADLPECRWYERNIGGSPRMRSDSFSVLHAAMLAGSGVMLVPASLVHSHPELVPLHTDLAVDVWVHLWLVAPPGEPTPRVGRVRQYLRDEAKDPDPE